MKRSDALQLRKLLMAYVESLDDDKAIDFPAFMDTWEEGTEYTVGQRIVYEGKVYKVLQDHTSISTWDPQDAVSLFSEVLVDRDEEGNQISVNEWVQPDSTNPYMTGDLVTYNGKTYRSTIDYNVWAPGVYGWEEA